MIYKSNNLGCEATSWNAGGSITKAEERTGIINRDSAGQKLGIDTETFFGRIGGSSFFN